MYAVVTLSTESEALELKVSRINTKIQKSVAFFDEIIDLLPPASEQGEHVSFIDNLVCPGSADGSVVQSFSRIYRLELRHLNYIPLLQYLEVSIHVQKNRDQAWLSMLYYMSL